MISNHEEDEFVAVRVQDPRIQHEGSWNSYVDYKIFLHTNSKAFTAKTSCVRRRYSEFVWLRKKLQKNAGLVPVPDLPGKSFFSFSNEDFLERRRKGLQVFLDKVVNMTVCLSDSQLHLFLQTQLPLGHIQDCVQGHTPYTVMDAILTYASSNRGLAQAQEDDSVKEPSLTVSYESMESPAPHQPSLQTNATYSPELLSCDTDPREGFLERCDQDPHKEKSSIRISQKSNHLQAVVEDCGPAEATFYLGESLDDMGSVGSAEPIQQSSCQIQTPVEVHSPIGTGFEEESVTTVDTDEKTAAHPDSQEKTSGEMINCEPETCVNSVAVLDFTDNVRSQGDDVVEDVVSEVNEGHVAGDDSDGQTEPDNKKSDESGSIEVIPLQSELHDEALNVNGVPEEDAESVGSDTVQGIHQKEDEQVVDLTGTKDESDEDDEDSHSLPSSNESIVKVSDEESICDEAEDQIQAANGFMKTPPVDVARWAEMEASSRNILDLHLNGCPEEKEDTSAQEDENLRYVTNMSKSLDLNSTVADGDSTENSDFSVIESSCVAGLVDGKCAEQEALSSLSLDASEETQELEVH